MLIQIARNPSSPNRPSHVGRDALTRPAAHVYRAASANQLCLLSEENRVSCELVSEVEASAVRLRITKDARHSPTNVDVQSVSEYGLSRIESLVIDGCRLYSSATLLAASKRKFVTQTGTGSGE
jgi:hypothetical protein